MLLSHREKERERDEGGVRGRKTGRERQRVCRKSMQDSPYLPGTHGWISWGCLNVCEMCMHKRRSLCVFVYVCGCVCLV